MKVYRKGTELIYRHFNFVLHQGGLGDLIAGLPAIKFVLDFHKNIIINLYCHDYAVDLCTVVFQEYKNITIRGMSSYDKTVNESLPARSPYVHKISNLSMNMVDQAFLSMVGTIPEDKYKSYLKLDPIDVSHFNLPEKYAVVTTGFTSETREWLPQSVNEVSDYLVAQGITPVYIGKSYTKAYKDTGITGNFKADYTKGINLIDKTNLFEAHSIMNDAVVTLGLDNGLMHLHSMGTGEAIWGFTTVRPEHRLPPNTNHLVVAPTSEELSCIFCQSNMTFATGEVCFTKCFYKDYKCLELMTSDKWIAKLKELGI
jgi:ADP-heptose:LPS heptosyltransferase